MIKALSLHDIFCNVANRYEVSVKNNYVCAKAISCDKLTF